MEYLETDLVASLRLKGHIPYEHFTNLTKGPQTFNSGINTLMFLMFNDCEKFEVDRYFCECIRYEFPHIDSDFDILIRDKADEECHFLSERLLREPTIFEKVAIEYKYLPLECDYDLRFPSNRTAAPDTPCAAVNPPEVNIITTGDNILTPDIPFRFTADAFIDDARVDLNEEFEATLIDDVGNAEPLPTNQIVRVGPYTYDISITNDQAMGHKRVDLSASHVACSGKRRKTISLCISQTDVFWDAPLSSVDEFQPPFVFVHLMRQVN